ncbi:MAG: glycosyltransferase family 39 protein [Patescibacteria group bacterium]
MSHLKKAYVFLLLLTIFIVSNWSLIDYTKFYRGHDPTHSSRIAEMSRALEDGHFPVRWTENFGFGYGMPLFEFYAPLPFYLGSFLYWLNLDMSLVINILYMISGLTALLGSYKLASKLFGSSAGLVAAAAFTLAPYRAVNIFVRGAMSEAWGIMIMPWILLEIVLILENRKNKKAWILLVLSLLVMMLSHNLTTLMFVPVSLIFAVFYALYTGAINWKKKRLVNSVFKIISAYLLSIGLTAFYLFPAFLEKDFTKISSILEGYFHYSHHFLYIRQFLIPSWGYGGSAWGPDDGISFFLGYGQLLALIISVLVLIQIFAKKIRSKKEIVSFFKNHSIYIFFGLAFIFSLYLSLLKSQWIWNNLLLINFIQFPWRWLTVAILFLSLINAYAVTLIKSKVRRYLFSFILIFVLLLNGRYFSFDESKKDSWEIACVSEECIREKMSPILPDYIYINQEPDIEPVKVGEITDHDTEILVNRGHEKLFRVRSEFDEKININIAAYPGWKVEIDGEGVDWETPLCQGFGNIIVEVPAGDHQVGVYFGYTPVRFWSDIISFLSLLIFLYLILDIKK